MADGPGARRHDSLRPGARRVPRAARTNDCVVITPGSRLTSARKAEITRYKGALRTLLRCDDGGWLARGLPCARSDAAKAGTLAGAAVRADVPSPAARCFSQLRDDLAEPWRSAAAGGAVLDWRQHVLWSRNREAQTVDNWTASNRCRRAEWPGLSDKEPMTAMLQRQIFRTSRALEYFSEKELVLQNRSRAGPLAAGLVKERSTMPSDGLCPTRR